MDEEIKKNLSDASIWLRLVYMFLFSLVIYIGIGVFAIVTLVQFLIVLISGEKNTKLLRFSSVLNQYLGQCLQFEGFLSEEKPFPFDDLPDADIDEEGLSVKDDNDASDDLRVVDN